MRPIPGAGRRRRGRRGLPPSHLWQRPLHSGRQRLRHVLRRVRVPGGPPRRPLFHARRTLRGHPRANHPAAGPDKRGKAAPFPPPRIQRHLRSGRSAMGAPQPGQPPPTAIALRRLSTTPSTASFRSLATARAIPSTTPSSTGSASFPPATPKAMPALASPAPAIPRSSTLPSRPCAATSMPIPRPTASLWA